MLSHTPLWKTTLAIALSAAAFSQPGLAQVPPASVLRIDTVNAVVYFEDTADVSKFATDPGTPTPLLPGKTFNRQIGIADIQAVNGQPVMGVHTRVGVTIGLSTAPTSGHAIADSVRNAADEISFEILKSDGTPIGTIMASGFIGGASPPGSPSKVTVVQYCGYWWHGSIPRRPGAGGCGGSSAGCIYTTRSLNNRGPREPAPQWRWNTTVGSPFDPDVRAANCDHCQRPGRDPFQRLLSCHSSKPAAAGEILSLFATGLGPTVPAVDPGQPFPSSPAALSIRPSR